MSESHLPVRFLALAALMPFVTPAFADEASCDAVFTAADTTAQTPHHAYVAVLLVKGMPPQSSETIFADGVAYDQLDGHWRRDPMTAEKLHQSILETRKEMVHRCRLVGNETMNDVPAVHYEMQAYDPKIGPGEAKSQVWISATHLLLRERVEMTKSSYADTRYEYANVRPPAGVK